MVESFANCTVCSHGLGIGFAPQFFCVGTCAMLPKIIHSGITKQWWCAVLNLIYSTNVSFNSGTSWNWDRCSRLKHDTNNAVLSINFENHLLSSMNDGSLTQWNAISIILLLLQWYLNKKGKYTEHNALIYCLTQGFYHSQLLAPELLDGPLWYFIMQQTTLHHGLKSSL